MIAHISIQVTKLPKRLGNTTLIIIRAACPTLKHIEGILMVDRGLNHRAEPRDFSMLGTRGGLPRRELSRIEHRAGVAPATSGFDGYARSAQGVDVIRIRHHRPLLLRLTTSNPPLFLIRRSRTSQTTSAPLRSLSFDRPFLIILCLTSPGVVALLITRGESL
jgi:hypothetical protein